MTDNDLANDKLKGVAEIAEFIDEPQRRTNYLLERKLIPGWKIGAIWHSSKAKLRAHYSGSPVDAA